MRCLMARASMSVITPGNLSANGVGAGGASAPTKVLICRKLSRHRVRLLTMSFVSQCFFFSVRSCAARSG